MSWAPFLCIQGLHPGFALNFSSDWPAGPVSLSFHWSPSFFTGLYFTLNRDAFQHWTTQPNHWKRILTGPRVFELAFGQRTTVKGERWHHAQIWLYVSSEGRSDYLGKCPAQGQECHDWDPTVNQPILHHISKDVGSKNVQSPLLPPLHSMVFQEEKVLLAMMSFSPLLLGLPHLFFPVAVPSRMHFRSPLFDPTLWKTPELESGALDPSSSHLTPQPLISLPK